MPDDPMPDHPLVSVVIATRNAERYLAQALESVRLQTYDHVEIVVVDGGSTDTTKTIAQSFAKVRLIDQSGSGLSDAWNCGIDAATGSLIAFLDSDDLYLPEKLALQVTALLRHEEAGYVDGRVMFFLEPGYPLPSGFRPELLDGPRTGFMPGTILVRRSMFARIGNFDCTLAIAGDVDWLARVKDAGVTRHVVEEVILRKRIHDGNLSLSASVEHELLRVLRQSVARQKGRTS